MKELNPDNANFIIIFMETDQETYAQGLLITIIERASDGKIPKGILVDFGENQFYECNALIMIFFEKFGAN